MDADAPTEPTEPIEPIDLTESPGEPDGDADRPIDLSAGGVELGPLAYGCWRFAGTGVAEAREKIETALACGMTLVDTADIYGWGGDGFGAAEELLGRVLAEAPELRDRMILATKGGIFPPLPYDSSAEYLRQAAEASCNRLGVDVVDLYQVHRPDLLAHPEEVAEALTDLRDRGLVREVGVSNHTPAQTRALQSYLDFPIVATQPEFSPLHLAPLLDGTFDLAMEYGLVPLTWSPLGGGRLGGAPGGKKAAAVAEVCDRIGAEQGVPRVAVILAWAMHHPAGCIPIVGTQQPDRIEDCARATEVGLSRQQWYEILVAARGEPMP